MNKTFLLLGGILGALAVGLGAFGAHGLRNSESAESLATWATAAHYHLIHAVMLVGVSLICAYADSKAMRAAGWLFTVGICIFSGTLYLLVLTDTRWLGAVTPIGGVCLISGWLLMAYAALKA